MEILICDNENLIFDKSVNKVLHEFDFRMMDDKFLVVERF
jgi:hypothetical protein